MEISIFSLILIVVVVVLLTLLSGYRDIVAYANQDDFICAKQNISALRNNVLVHEECHLLVFDDPEHFCSDKDVVNFFERVDTK